MNNSRSSIVTPLPIFPGAQFDVVVLASSAGGISVLKTLVERLPESFPAPIMVVQHRPAFQPDLLRQILAQRTPMRVVQAETGQPLVAGRVYVAPPGRHLEVSDQGLCQLTDGDRVNFCRPAADILFSSAARRFGSRTLGVVLTGFLHDGAAGTSAIRAAGGVVIAQDPSTCLASSMPLAAIRNGADFLLPPRAISAALVSLVATTGVAEMFGVGRFRRAA